MLVKDDKAQRVLQFRLVAQRIYAKLPAAGRAPPRRLCPRRQSLHRPASRLASGGVQAAPLSPKAWAVSTR